MRKLVLVICTVFLAVYAATGIYEVKPEESGVAYIFGRIVNPEVTPGIHWNMPAPIGRQVMMPTRLTQVMNVGYGGPPVSPANFTRREDLWFTGGASVVECRLDVQYRISRLDQYLLSHNDPDTYMKLAAERAATRFFAGLHVDDILTTKRQTLVSELTTTLQTALDDQELGIQVQDVAIVHLAPPLAGGVSNSFRQVQSARSEREREIENARSGASRALFEAQAEAETMTSRARGDQFARVERARAQAERFRALAREKAAAPELIETRLYRDIVPTALQRAKLYVVPNETDGVTVE